MLLMTLLTGLLRVSLIISEVMSKNTIVVKSHEPSTILSVLTNTHMGGGGGGGGVEKLGLHFWRFLYYGL